MADTYIKISELEETTLADDSSYIPIDNGNHTYKISVENYNSGANATAQSYAEAAAASADDAETAKTAAETAETETGLIRTATQQYATAASGSASAAASSAVDALNYADSAASAAANAADSAQDAAESYTNAAEKAVLSESWAVGGTNTRTGEDTNNSQYYAAVATSAAENAEDQVELANAASTAASGSAVDAAASATEASGYADDASDYATAASGSATAAATSATQSANSAGAAATSATNAAASATAAAGSASTATTQANNAAQSATTAGGYATQAASSASDASGYATNAANSATAAAGSATTASNQATAAAGSATAAAASASDAADSAADAAESAATFTTDDTLTIAGKAADAKATGDMITAVQAEIPELDNWLTTPGAAAEAKHTGDRITDLEDDVTDLKSAIDDCFIFGTTVYVQINNDSASVIEYKENGNRGYIGNTGNFTASATYATFLYNVIADGYVWFDATTGNKSLAVFRTNQIGSANFIARYRTNDGNLPDADHKLAVTAGQMLAIGVSVSASTEQYNRFILNVPEIDTTIKLTNDVKLNTTQEDDIARIAAEIKRQTGTIVKSGSDYIITNRNARYTIRRFDRADIREYVWRIYKGEISDGAGNWIKLWESSDTDGVIKISGEDDFVGGYHGDETETFFAIYIDGVLKTGESVDMPYQTIELYQESDVYHCDTSQTPNVVAFKRNKILRFDADGCHVCNYWTAQENLDLQYIYPGMLSVNRYVSGTSGTYLLTGYHTDGNYKYMDADTGLDADHAVAKVIMSTLYGYAEIDTHYITDDPAFATSITDYDTESSQRLKVYSGLRNVQMSAGDSVRAEATIII